jgi:hypothetical protein
MQLLWILLIHYELKQDEDQSNKGFRILLNENAGTVFDYYGIKRRKQEESYIDFKNNRSSNFSSFCLKFYSAEKFTMHIRDSFLSILYPKAYSFAHGNILIKHFIIESDSLNFSVFRPLLACSQNSIFSIRVSVFEELNILFIEK